MIIIVINMKQIIIFCPFTRTHTGMQIESISLKYDMLKTLLQH